MGARCDLKRQYCVAQLSTPRVCNVGLARNASNTQMVPASIPRNLHKVRTSCGAVSRDNGHADTGSAEEGHMPRGGVAGFSPDALRRAIQRAGLTADELGDVIGVSRQAVEAWLRGETVPSPQSLHKAAAALHADSSSLTLSKARDVHLADLRIRAGLSQAAAARQVGISATTLRLAERGQRKALDPDLAHAIARVYGVSVEEVVAAWEVSNKNRADWLQGRAAARRTRI
jgi:transcriptional regulator with XRE-family HTH domain